MPPLPRLDPVAPQPQPQADPLPKLLVPGLGALAQGALRLGYQNMTGLTTVTFQSIRQDLSALLVISKLRHNAAVGAANVGIRFNNDSTSPHYYSSSVFAANAAPGYANTTDQSQIDHALLSAGTVNTDFCVSFFLVIGYAQADISHNTIQGGGHFQLIALQNGLWGPPVPQAINRIDVTSPGAAYIASSGIWLLGLP